jgi:hypothetical protein
MFARAWLVHVTCGRVQAISKQFCSSLLSAGTKVETKVGMIVLPFQCFRKKAVMPFGNLFHETIGIVDANRSTEEVGIRCVA